jgi:nucleoside-diphosphate-sugar epimerase
VDLKGGWTEFRKLTIEGTQRLLEAALPAGPARLVYVSSAGVYSPGVAGCRFCAERTPAEPAGYNLYGRAKLAAEDLIRTECQRAGCEWTIVRLGATYGPYKRSLLTHFRPMLERGRLWFVGRGDNAIAALYVDDAAEALVRAGAHPAAAGKIYDVAGDERITQREWFDATADALELPRPRRHVPRMVAYAAAAAAEAWARVRGTDPPFNRAMVVLVSTDQLLDSGRARAELGWRPRVSFAEGIRRTHAWYAGLRGEGVTTAGVDGEPAGKRWLASPGSRSA